MNTDCTFLHYPQDRDLVDISRGICDRNRPELVWWREGCRQHKEDRPLLGRALDVSRA